MEDAIADEAMGHAATTTAPARSPMSRFVDDSPLEGGGFELPVPRAMQERLKAIIAGFGCNPPSPDYLRLLSADITEGEPKRLGTGSLNARLR